jgi:hypothetical protein
MAKSNFSLFMLSVLNALAPYLVLFLVIIFIILLVKGLSRASSTSNPEQQGAYSSLKSRPQIFFESILSKLRSILNIIAPGHKVRSFFGMFSLTGPKYNAIPRSQMKSGRCDNNRWIQIDNEFNKNVVLDVDGQSGKCYSAVSPKDIVWELDASKMGELYELPAKRQDDLKKYMTVTIPYETDSSVKDGNTFFIPRCNDAYYGDDPTNKADMFEDLGTACKIKVHPLLKAKYSVSSKTRNQVVSEMRT